MEKLAAGAIVSEEIEAALDERKVDGIGQGLFQRSRRVEPGFLPSERIVRAEKRQWIGLEEPSTNRRSCRRAPQLLARADELIE
jgi:hypothetical protein